MFTDSQLPTLRAQIALPLLPEVGLRRAKDLIQTFGSAERAMVADKDEWMALLPNAKQSFVNNIFSGRQEALDKADKELEFISQHNIQVFCLGEDDYPSRLAECPDAPLILYAKGNIRPNDGKFVAVVGTRSPSDRGKQICHDFIGELAAKVPDVTIVSGLAYGTDIAAHRAALEFGLPTFIIPGHGLDRIYPSIHRQVAVQALETGGVLTEYMSGTEPIGPNFVARNRIIAGLSDAIVVVESKDKGGSLITADMAFSYGRDLFAFPGRPSDPLSAGCNRLIKSMQANLIESADDLIAEMRWTPKVQNEAYQLTLDRLLVDLAPEEQAIMDILRQNEDGIHVNSIVMELKMPYSGISALLMQMELKGLVKSLPGSFYRALN